MKEAIVFFPKYKVGDPDPMYVDPKVMQELVRCTDCEYGYCLNPSCDVENRYFQCLATYINGMRITHKGDWFCADGKRKE